MASSESSNTANSSERCPVIDSWKSWKEIGEAQLQASQRNNLANLPTIMTPLEQYKAFDSQGELVQYRFPSYNHEDWIVTRKPMLYSSDGVCVENESWNIHDREIFHEISWINAEKETRNFHLFSSLPVEVRRQIWKFALPRPRVLKLSLDRKDSSNTRTGRPFITRLDYSIRQLVTNRSLALDFRNISRTMKITCQESRQVFLENYRSIPLRGASIASLWDEGADSELSDIGNIPEVKYKSLYFDRNRDTLALRYPDLEQLNTCNAWLDLAALKNVAISHLDNKSTVRGTKAILNEWPHIRRLDIIFGDLTTPDRGHCPTDICRLIEIQDHDSLDFISDSCYSSSCRHVGQRKRKLIDQRNEIMSKLRSIDLDLVDRDVDFEFCLVGTIQGDGYTVRDPTPTPIYLVPRQPRVFGVSYYTVPLPEYYDTHERRNRMMIFELGCQAACLHDGTMLQVLGGDVMRTLFGESD
ncbi:hypothetical protein L207DRAFT_575563 [Hyaloscypha variabilis F]|uniref:2EXR domain-containing protein n=1 Tax=Hyaloscypha variabilis (strain UAMH 11265 / GT02V1 / F) TaxID=1149755 RepID=A0A2J6SDS9_HYAVF|nr:hypothetical protein L207DRAFT_575563 [Hyaloscypha variabilis F]